MDGIGEYHLKLASVRMLKATYPPSYADCRPKTNLATLWDMGHTKRGCAGRDSQGKETKNLNEVDVLTVQE
jgi:hypothetical protein